MQLPNILVTCPPMLGLIDEFKDDFDRAKLTYIAADVTQVLNEEELIALVPRYEGWIIGDDPATKQVITAGANGRLKAAVKWGVGTDNIDFAAFDAHNIPVTNTPGVFGGEVADIALAYTLGLARETYLIDREIRLNNAWPKPSGISVAGRKVGLVGFGDIGASTAKRLIACGADIIAYDPFYTPIDVIPVTSATWPERLDEMDFLIFTCPLNTQTKGMLNFNILPLLKPGVRIINVARGPVIEEQALLKGLNSGLIHSAALDVFEVEPLLATSPLRQFDRCIFGSHNGSNSADAVRRVSRIAIQKITEFLKAA